MTGVEVIPEDSPSPSAAASAAASASASASVAGAVTDAFAGAREVRTAWAALDVRGRLRILRAFRHLLPEHADELTRTVHRPPAETLSAQIIPLADAIRFLERHAARTLAPRVAGFRQRPLWLFGVTQQIRREPFGTILILAPSNYPIFIPGTQAVQALASGNAVVLKPGTGGRPAALALQRLLVEAGLDRRLLAVLPESVDAARLALQQAPDRILATGSQATGRVVLEAAAQSLTPCTLELAGSDAVVVRADADLARVTSALIFGLRLNDGATCIAPRRVFADHTLIAALETRLAAAMAHLPRIPIPASQRDRLLPLANATRGAGARLLHPTLLDSGTTHGPVVLTRVPPNARILDTDLFAPVLSLVQVDGDAGAVDAMARCRFALGASIFSADLRSAQALANRLPAGVVTINDLILPTADPRVPFGGRGASGYGVTRGREGLLELTRTKVIATRRGRWTPHLQAERPGDEELFASVFRLTHGRGLMARLNALVRMIRLVRNRSTARETSHPHP